MTNEELKEAIWGLKWARQRLDDATAEYERCKNALRDHMIETGKETEDAEGYRLMYQTVKTTRLDGDALRAAMPDICAKFTKTSETKRFSIKALAL